MKLGVSEGGVGTGFRSREESLPMTVTIRMLLADDPSLVLWGIRETLTTVDDIALVGESSRGDEAQRLCHDLQPGVLLLDLQMPGATEIETVTYVGVATRERGLPLRSARCMPRRTETTNRYATSRDSSLPSAPSCISANFGTSTDGRPSMPPCDRISTGEERTKVSSVGDCNRSTVTKPQAAIKVTGSMIARISPYSERCGSGRNRSKEKRGFASPTIPTMTCDRRRRGMTRHRTERAKGEPMALTLNLKVAEEGAPVWAIIGALTENGSNQRHPAAIDAHLAVNSIP